MPEKIFDLIVIGGGPAGHAAAEDAARYGARVCIVEKAQWGGTCTHRGCVPTKALLICSKHFAELKKLNRLGITAGEIGYDFNAIRRHRDQMVRIAALGVEKSLKDAGVEMKVGKGTIVSPGEVAWTEPEGQSVALTARHIVIAWGSEPALPLFSITPHLSSSLQPSAPPIQAAAVSTPPSAPAPQHAPARILTSDTFLQLTTLPKSMVIIGGGVIGVEFATFLAELGVPVQIVEFLPAILPYEEEEAATLLLKELNRIGVKVLTATKVEDVREDPEGVCIIAAKDGQTMELTAEYALLCTGRRPRLDVESLINMGIRYDRRGVAVDEKQETNIAGIFAVGDVTGGIMLAHRAMQQGRALANRLFGDGSIVFRADIVPSVTYSHPPIARVGLTELQAGEKGWSVEIVRTDYGANIMARTELAGQGFAKFIFHKNNLVGATIIGAGAPDLIASLSLALTTGADLKTFKSWIIPHPTLSEVLKL
ncbi:MAG: NAD(P)/FAD-dependent oxidoreductase [Syntrophales bacterium]|jgi:dihydrolipoamide dehydrogenase|nr:NAD(P)/FAD-dependent oxidoreductase [Syntrophales bacterium]MCK9391425.1 NAD(P)/FAD-dependent oxidoreductase [Syntrophales bacterium]